MKNFDETGRALCTMQAELFTASIKEANCSSAIFLRRFMNSSVAKRMDSGAFLNEANSIETIFEEIDEEFGKSDYGKEKFEENEMYWMGYIYRYWCYTKGISSKQAYKIIKPSKLRQLYFPYHSLDNSAAVERILEAENKDEKDLIARGVEIMRRITKA